MKTVLGIDAAWTATQPSGVALVVDDGSGWQLRRVAASYDHFLSDGSEHSLLVGRPLGSLADAGALLARAETLAGRSVDLVAIDMPLSLRPVTSRRPADNKVSAAYGARHCSTHSPSAERPGRISDDLRGSFQKLGYSLATVQPSVPALIEVYPHPALVELMTAPRRLPYKQSRVASYWPTELPSARRERLLEVWQSIVRSLDRKIAGVANLLPILSGMSKAYQLKAFEDMLDAVICCWVGTCVLDGRATAFGDETSAIWIPRPLDPQD